MTDSNSRPEINVEFNNVYSGSPRDLVIDSTVENIKEENEDVFDRLDSSRLDTSRERRTRNDSCNSSMSSNSFENYMNLNHLDPFTRPNSSSSSIIDISSPNVYSNSPSLESSIFLPVTETGNLVIPSLELINQRHTYLKRISARQNSDPVNIINDIVSIQKNRLDELEYMEKYMKEIISLNVNLYAGSSTAK